MVDVKINDHVALPMQPIFFSNIVRSFEKRQIGPKRSVD